MNRPRVPSASKPHARPSIGPRVCRLGGASAEARREQDLSIQAVGSRLLLSPAQVAALEEVNPDAFYSAEFYVSALKKYAGLLAFESDQLDRLLVGPERTDKVAPAAFKRGRRLPEAPLIPVRPRKTAIAAAVVIVTGLVAWPLLSTFQSTPTRQPGVNPVRPADVVLTQPPPAESFVSPAVTNPAVAAQVVAAVDTTTGAEPAEPARAMEDQAPSSRESVAATDVYGRVRVEAPTWIFVRYANNSTSERGLAAGDEFVLRQLPTYLAVGSAQGTHIEIGGREINSAAFIANGQLRIGSSSLARLRSDQ